MSTDSPQTANPAPAPSDFELGADRRLVERMLGGDEAALDEFADRFFPRLYRYALRRLRGDRDLTRDLVQTTVCKALEKLESYRGEAPLFGWLCACCRNEIAMYFRSSERRYTSIEMNDEIDTVSLTSLPLGSPMEAAHQRLERREEAALVHEALDGLPEHYARALEWKYLDHLPVVEIAQRLRLGPKAAESVLTRARNAFRKAYRHLTAQPQTAPGTGGIPA